MNNIDRMVQEVRRFAAEPWDGGPPPDVLEEMLMKVVDLEDQNLLKAVAGINKKLDEIVRSVADGMDDRA